MSARDVILSRIRRNGPVTLAEYMEIALYEPEHGYYAKAAQRSGRGGDFYTSVDTGALFGELLAVQFDEMRERLGGLDEGRPFDLVEAAAGNGRLTRDVMDAAGRGHPDLYRAARIWLTERSGAARASQEATLGRHASKLAGSSPALPAAVRGVIFANELLDAMPAHGVIMRPEGLREVYVAERGGTLVEIEDQPSTGALARHFEAVGAWPPPGVRADVSLAQTEWIASAARALDAGFLVLIDYGRPARELYSEAHASGTLMSYRSHVAGLPDWLNTPGDVDLTTHVDLTAVQAAARASGLDLLGAVDQTYFLTSLGLAERLPAGGDRQSVSRRLAAKTLMMPGGLGSTMKVLVFGKAVGAPALRGLSAGRLT